MSAFERVALLLAVLRDLGEVMRAETELVRSMRLERLSALQEEKERLALAYELALREMRTEPELLASLDGGSRAELEAAMRGFQETVRGNVHRLRAAQEVVEGVMRCLGRALAAPGAGYGRHAGAATVVPLSLDRRA